MTRNGILIIEIVFPGFPGYKYFKVFSIISFRNIFIFFLMIQKKLVSISFIEQNIYVRFQKQNMTKDINPNLHENC